MGTTSWFIKSHWLAIMKEKLNGDQIWRFIKHKGDFWLRSYSHVRDNSDCFWKNTKSGVFRKKLKRMYVCVCVRTPWWLLPYLCVLSPQTSCSSLSWTAGTDYFPSQQPQEFPDTHSCPRHRPTRPPICQSWCVRKTSPGWLWCRHTPQWLQTSGKKSKVRKRNFSPQVH